MTEYKYIADNAWKNARERLQLLEMEADPWTIRNLRQIGVAPSWHCLEVAAAVARLPPGSVPRWVRAATSWLQTFSYTM